MKKRELTCIGCPLGCSLSVSIDGDNIVVEGNNCLNGEKYAKNEVTNPTRIVTSTIRVRSHKIERVSCKTAGPIPKAKIFSCMDEIKAACVDAPIKIGDILIENVADTGINVVATKNIE